ncbi:MAG: hypothetical protein ACLVKA_04010 [Collinsella aerofaciens]
MRAHGELLMPSVARSGMGQVGGNKYNTAASDEAGTWSVTALTT